jgi:Lipopolysaccharide kinase (Kdo/WaaP) family
MNPSTAWSFSGWGASYRIERAAGLEAGAIQAILSEHHGILARGGPRLVQPRHWRPVTRVALGEREFAVKQYGAGAFGARLRCRLAGSRARRAWGAHQELAGRDVPTAPPVAWVEISAWNDPVESYLVTGWVAGCYPSERLAELRGDGDEAGCRRFLAAGGVFLGRTHAAGVWLEDFWNRNFLVPAAPAEPDRFILVDCDDVRLRGLDGPRRLKNLRQFSRAFARGTTEAGWRVFAAAYLEAAGAPPSGDGELLDGLVALLEVPSHEGILDRLCRDRWRALRPLFAGGRRA